MQRSSYVQGVPYPTGYFNQYLAEQRQTPQAYYAALNTAVETQPAAPAAPAVYQPVNLMRVQLPAEALQQPQYQMYLGKPAFYDSARGVFWDGHNVHVYKEAPALHTAIETQPQPAYYSAAAPQQYPQGSPFYVEAPSVYVLKSYS